MTIILYCLCAILLTLTGALVSGGLTLPVRHRPDAHAAQADDALERDIAALLAYGGEEDADEI